MKYKKLGNSDKVLEFYTSDPSYYVETPPNHTEPKVAEQQEEEPRNDVCEAPVDRTPGISPANDPKHETLSASMEYLSLNTDIPNPTSVQRETNSELDEEEEPLLEMVVQPSPSPSVDVTSPKHKGRQRRQESSTRKKWRAKQERKEAAKRRKQEQKMGIIQDHSTLKSIII